ncbi:MAG: serine protease [Rhizobiaceae bacterium]|nr:serine protease [Rhizobiaceae bacterium]
MAAFDLGAFSDAVADIAAGAHAVTAAIHLEHGRTASAFHWGDGIFVAAEERIDPDEQTTMTLPDGQTVRAALVGRDPSTGIALLKPDGENSLAVLPKAETLRPGNLVILAGRGEDGGLAVLGTAGEVGPAWRSMRGGTIDRRITLAAAAGGRFEGGPVLDARGALVGVLLFGPRMRALVIPHETVERAVATLRDKGHVSRGYLGASLHPVRDANLKGAMVMRLDDEGPAKKAGMQIGDVIVGWNGDPVSGPRTLMRKLGTDAVGADVKLWIMRGGESREVPVTIGGRPLS